jgi:hypothetical protein
MFIKLFMHYNLLNTPTHFIEIGPTSIVGTSWNIGLCTLMVVLDI